MTTSSDRFTITIRKKTGTYSNGSSTLSPLGYPIIRREWSKSDQCELHLHDMVQGVTTTSSLLNEVSRSDTAEVKIDGAIAFFGEIFRKQWLYTGGRHMFVIYAKDFLNLGAYVQLDRVVHNGFIQDQLLNSDSTRTTTVPEITRPIVKLEKYEPGGSITCDAFADFGLDNGEISNDGTTVRRIGIVFKPESNVLNALYLALWDPDEYNPVPASGNSNPTDKSIRMQLYTAAWDETNDIYTPDTLVTTASGANVQYDYVFIRETWIDKTVGNYTTGPITETLGTYGDLNWTVSRTGTSQVQIIGAGLGSTTTEVPVVSFGWNDKHARLNHAGTGSSVTMETATPGSLVSGTNRADGGWVGIQFIVSTTSGIGGKIRIYLNDGTSDIEAARVQIEGANMVLYYGENGENDVGSTFLTSFTAGHEYYVYFRFHLDGSSMDFYYYDGTVTPATVFVQSVPIMNRDSITASPLKVSKYSFSCDGSAAGNFDIGFVSGSEISTWGTRYKGPGGHWAYLNFHDDPVPVQRDSYYFMVLSASAASTFSTRDKVYIHQDAANTGISDLTKFFFYRNDGGGWVDTDGTFKLKPFGFMIETGDSWKPAFEHPGFEETSQDKADFILEYDDVNNSGVIYWRDFGLRDDDIFTGQGGARNIFGRARLSTYTNPSSNKYGIVVNDVHTGVYIAHRMTLSDVVKYIASFVADWGTTAVTSTVGGSDDAIGSGWHSDTNFQIDQYLIKQKSVNDALRDLALRWNGLLTISADLNKNITFEAINSRSNATNNPTSYNPAAREYVISRDSFIDSDANILLDNKIEEVEQEVFTDFIIKGADEGLTITYINFPLAAIIGHKVKTETFPKETFIDNLWEYAELLNKLHGLQRREGTITVSGYRPIASNRLDLNGIVRLIDSEMENGNDLTGTNNVYKIISLEYNGDANQTLVFLSNQDIGRTKLEERLEELRKQLQDQDPGDPNTHLHLYNDTVVTSSLAASWYDTPRYMALIDTNGAEPGKTTGVDARQPTQHFTTVIDGTTYHALTAYFPPGQQTIFHDQAPIAKVVIYPTKATAVGGESLSTTNFYGSKNIYKWADVGVVFTMWIEKI